MADRRFLTVFFNDGSKLTISYEKQISDDLVASKLREALSSRNFAFEADGDLYVVPTASIKYIQQHPAPSKLPDNVIKGARMVATSA